ncbi:MAG: 50S ribosomal protein L21 [Parachlamydiales bacterium]|jgi:large subunit ribosomal protein L21
MYAIIQTGSKQYKIEEGGTYEIELLSDINDGIVEFKEILLLNDGNKIIVGKPFVDNCKVNAEVVEQVKGPKVITYKYKERKNSRRKKGHRQKYLKIKVNKIELI